MQFATSALAQTTTHQLGTTNQTQQGVAPNCCYQGFSGSWQFFLEGCRASHHDSKHSLSPTIYLNHMVIHNYLINAELYLTFSKYGDKLLVVKSLINILKFAYFNIIFYYFFCRYLWFNKSLNRNALMLFGMFMDASVWGIV